MQSNGNKCLWTTWASVQWRWSLFETVMSYLAHLKVFQFHTFSNMQIHKSICVLMSLKSVELIIVRLYMIKRLKELISRNWLDIELFHQQKTIQIKTYRFCWKEPHWQNNLCAISAVYKNIWQKWASLQAPSIF